MIREFDNDRWNGYPYMTNERVREKCLEICRKEINGIKTKDFIFTKDTA